jgi:hypothetical protein
MIESWPHCACDGCGETEYHRHSNTTRAQARAELKAGGSHAYAGDLDYWPRCVKRGIAARREASMNA